MTVRELGSAARRSWLMLAMVVLVWPNSLKAQTAAYTLDLDRSSAWWQIDPHFGHLWASTCPLDPSWQPGEGHSAGYYINYATRPKIATTHENEKKIPLFPRKTVRPNCRHAVKGAFTVTDTVGYKGTKGYVILLADSLETGADHRNAFAHKYVYDAVVFPEIRFTVDSLSAVQVSGDTINAVAVGTFEFRGVTKATRVQIVGNRDKSGLRIRGTFAMPAADMERNYGVSKYAMGAGVGLKLWDTLFMGIDVILVRAASQ
jgi:hypothetical protein